MRNLRGRVGANVSINKLAIAAYGRKYYSENKEGAAASQRKYRGKIKADSVAINLARLMHVIKTAPAKKIG